MRTTDEILDAEDWGRSDLIDHMKEFGWNETESGRVSHPEVSQSFNSWGEAIKACIGFASEA